MKVKKSDFAISRRSLLKAAGVTAVTGGVLTTPATAEQPENNKENRRDQDNRPEGVGTLPQGIGTSPVAHENIE